MALRFFIIFITKKFFIMYMLSKYMLHIEHNKSKPQGFILFLL